MTVGLGILELVQRELDKHIEVGGAEHLPSLIPLARPEDLEVEFIAMNPPGYLSPEFLSFSSPEGVGVYEGVWTQTRTDGLFSDAFVRGASALAFAVADDDRPVMTNVLNHTLEAMEQYTRYPSVAVGLVSRVLEVDLAILTNGETSNREHLMAYNLGVWFMVGHLQDFSREEHDSSVFGAAWLTKVLVARAERAMQEES